MHIIPVPQNDKERRREIINEFPRNEREKEGSSRAGGSCRSRSSCIPEPTLPFSLTSNVVPLSIGANINGASAGTTCTFSDPISIQDDGLLDLKRQVSVGPESGNQAGTGEGKDPLFRDSANTDLSVEPRPTVSWEVAPDTPDNMSTILMTQSAKPNLAEASASASAPAAKTPPSAPPERQSHLSGDPDRTHSATSASASAPSSKRPDHHHYPNALLASSWATFGETQDPSSRMDLPTFHFSDSANNHQQQQDDVINWLQFRNVCLHCSAILGLLLVVAIALGVLFGIGKS